MKKLKVLTSEINGNIAMKYPVIKGNTLREISADERPKINFKELVSDSLKQCHSTKSINNIII